MLLSEYDAVDGAIDGLIWEPTKIEPNREAVSFLSDAQFGTLALLQERLWLANVTRFPVFNTGRGPPGLGVAETGERLPGS